MGAVPAADASAAPPGPGLGSGLAPGLAGEASGAVRCARYCMTILALSVLPAPLSPLIRMACRCSSIIMALNACPARATCG